MADSPPKAVRTLEDCLLLLEGLLSSLGLELTQEGSFEERTQRVWVFLQDMVPSQSLILRPQGLGHERLYS